MTALTYPFSTSVNGFGSGMMDGSGTINPAALNSSAGTYQTMLPGATSNNGQQQSPRGMKRSRSPNDYSDAVGEVGSEDEANRRKRGRPPKDPKNSDSPGVTTSPNYSLAAPVQTPQLQTQSLPQTSPNQASPPRTTPTKTTVVKALPTVRDHTTDQLGPKGDEYIPREIDEAGEKKVSETGHPLGNREYRCRTFYVLNRGDKLFMLATECARVLGYRDSYLLFNKNRSLYKIIATQMEKDDLIAKEILPYSYRSRQIAIVTARSMFRQFGSRLIVNGRRVRDDYWESKARKQGFTEEDAAGEKRPGAARAREAAAGLGNMSHLTALPHGEIIYTNSPSMEGYAPPLPQQQLPMIQPIDESFRNVQRPRQEIAGAPYVDRTQSSSGTEILNQASHAAEYNRTLTQQRSNRVKYIDDIWRRDHATPQKLGALETTAEPDPTLTAPQGLQSPQQTATTSAVGAGTINALSHQQHPSQMMGGQQYSQQPHQQMPTQSPVRVMNQRTDQMHRSPLGMGTPGHAQTPSYGGYNQNQMWPQQAQPSPLSQSHSIQYGQQQSPHPQQSPHMPPQLSHQQSSGSMHNNPISGYGGMAGGMSYAGMRNPYQATASPQQFMHTSGGNQPGMWAPTTGQGHPQQGWQGY
ncbi:MAG: hypothetical protein M1820_002421 [Bogoriella megaspora]|nr:MAG: hypothetical protein M1820_002421 [Bogoriella megaspora]